MAYTFTDGELLTAAKVNAYLVNPGAWGGSLGTSDLNTINTPGWYGQGFNVNATLARNYPVTWAGFLEVFTIGNLITQRYTVYSNGGGDRYVNSTWTRGSADVGITWSAWRSDSVSNWTAVGTLQNSYTAAAPSPAYQIRGSVVYLSGQLYRATAPTYETAFTLPAGPRGAVTVVNRSHTSPDTIQITASGAVQVSSASARTTATGYLLDGISFIIG